MCWLFKWVYVSLHYVWVFVSTSNFRLSKIKSPRDGSLHQNLTFTQSWCIFNQNCSSSWRGPQKHRLYQHESHGLWLLAFSFYQKDQFFTSWDWWSKNRLCKRFLNTWVNNIPSCQFSTLSKLGPINLSINTHLQDTNKIWELHLFKQIENKNRNW